MVYGHYDVQPPDPLESLGNAALRADRAGRHASTPAGPPTTRATVVAVIQAVEALVQTGGGKPPVNLAFIFEGEEEIGIADRRPARARPRAV